MIFEVIHSRIIRTINDQVPEIQKGFLNQRFMEPFSIFKSRDMQFAGDEGFKPGTGLRGA